MITKEYLAQYVHLESEIKRLKRRLRYYKNNPLAAEHGVVSGSMKRYPYVKCHYVISGSKVKSDEDRKAAVAQLAVDLEGNLMVYEDMKVEIEHFLESVTDLEMKGILKDRYVEQKSYEKIGESLGYDRTSISKKIDNYLKSIERGGAGNEISSMLR